MSHREIFYYDSRSNLTCVRDDDLGLTYYTYDAGNRMTSVKNPFGEVAYYEYTPGGRMTKRILGNGCVTYYGYDAIGWVTKVDNRKSDLSVISSFEYERDPVGNPVSILREDGSVVYYEYDPKHQLTRETQRDSQGQDIYAWEWDYDAAGNRTYEIFNGVTTYYEYNEANELTEETTDGVATYYSYDRCGNTTAKQEPTGTTYYHWDYENLLRQIDLPDGAHNYFTYDADSKRVSKQDSEGFAEFIYQGPDMLRLLLERDDQGVTQAHYTMGDGLESMRRDSTSSFYHFDALGSTFELTDAAEDVTDTYLYNAWGEALERTGSTVNPHTYVGKERYFLTPDPVFYLLGLRYYAPRGGRFSSVDPVREGLDWFLYAGNVPTHAIDPRGLRVCRKLYVYFPSALSLVFPNPRALCEQVEKEPRRGPAGHNIGGLGIPCKAGLGTPSDAARNDPCVYTLEVRYVGDVTAWTTAMDIESAIAYTTFGSDRIVWRMTPEAWSGYYYAHFIAGYDRNQAAINVLKHELVHLLSLHGQDQGHQDPGPVLRRARLSGVYAEYGRIAASWSTWDTMNRMRRSARGILGRGNLLDWPDWDPDQSTRDKKGRIWDCRCLKTSWLRKGCKDEWPPF
jgi:RHS repeat-associated protein